MEFHTSGSPSDTQESNHVRPPTPSAAPPSFIPRRTARHPGHGRARSSQAVANASTDVSPSAGSPLRQRSEKRSSKAAPSKCPAASCRSTSPQPSPARSNLKFAKPPAPDTSSTGAMVPIGPSNRRAPQRLPCPSASRLDRDPRMGISGVAAYFVRWHGLEGFEASKSQSRPHPGQHRRPLLAGDNASRNPITDRRDGSRNRLPNLRSHRQRMFRSSPPATSVWPVLFMITAVNDARCAVTPVRNFGQK